MIVAAWAALIFAGSTFADVSAAPAPVDLGPCATGEQVLRAYRETDLGRREGARTLDIYSGPEVGEMSVSTAVRASGECAGHLRGFHAMARFFGAAGEVGVVQSIDTWLPTSSPWTLSRFVAIRSDEPHPDLSVPGTFVMASRVGGAPTAIGQRELYVGLWRRPADALIALFQRNPDGSFTRPEMLLTSALPVRSLTHFKTTYDPLYGAIQLVQDDGASGEARLVRVTWRRPASLSGGPQCAPPPPK